LIDELATITPLPSWVWPEIRSRVLREAKQQSSAGSGTSATSTISPRCKEAIEKLTLRCFSTAEIDSYYLKRQVLLLGLLFRTPVKFSEEQLDILHKQKEDYKTAALVSNNKEIRTILNTSGSRKQFAVTKGGYMTLVPWGTESGDVLSIFWGSRTPHVLRRVPGSALEQEGRFRLVGDAYIHGLMDGAVFVVTTCARKWFRII
jgi:hypothetical protein